MGFVESRSRRPEERGRVGRRFECGLPPHGPGRTAMIKEERPEESFDRDPDDHCGRCERPIWCVIRETTSMMGEGAVADAQMRRHKARRGTVCGHRRRVVVPATSTTPPGQRSAGATPPGRPGAGRAASWSQ